VTEPSISTLRLPWEGIEALRTVLGIIEDNEVKVDDVAFRNLEAKLSAAPMQLGSIGAGDEDREIELDLAMTEAQLLLDALQFTDVMSMHLPFYDMVVETVQFVGDRITDLWTPEVWMRWRDARRVV
jgi:hypothetical protein